MNYFLKISAPQRSNWVVQPAEKSQYDVMFKKVDMDADGLVSGMNTFNFFLDKKYAFEIYLSFIRCLSCQYFKKFLIVNFIYCLLLKVVKSKTFWSPLDCLKTRLLIFGNTPLVFFKCQNSLNLWRCVRDKHLVNQLLYLLCFYIFYFFVFIIIFYEKHHPFIKTLFSELFIHFIFQELVRHKQHRAIKLRSVCPCYVSAQICGIIKISLF